MYIGPDIDERDDVKQLKQDGADLYYLVSSERQIPRHDSMHSHALHPALQWIPSKSEFTYLRDVVVVYQRSSPDQ